MSVVVDVASVIAATEIIKRLVSRIAGFTINGELTILLAAVVGAVLSVAQGGEVVNGLLQGGAAVGSVEVARNLGGK